MSVINLNERNKIIQSQKQFWDLLDANVMNNIINFFMGIYSKLGCSKFSGVDHAPFVNVLL